MIVESEKVSKETKSKMELCLMDGNKKQCMTLDEMGVKTRVGVFVLKGLIGFYLFLVIGVTIASYLSGSLGYDVVGGLKLSLLFMIYPLFVIGLGLLAYGIWELLKLLDIGTTINTLIVIIIVITVSVAGYFFFVWLNDIVVTNWIAINSSWS